MCKWYSVTGRNVEKFHLKMKTLLFSFLSDDDPEAVFLDLIWLYLQRWWWLLHYKGILQMTELVHPLIKSAPSSGSSSGLHLSFCVASGTHLEKLWSCLVMILPLSRLMTHGFLFHCESSATARSEVIDLCVWPFDPESHCQLIMSSTNLRTILADHTTEMLLKESGKVFIFHLNFSLWMSFFFISCLNCSPFFNCPACLQ